MKPSLCQAAFPAAVLIAVLALAGIPALAQDQKIDPQALARERCVTCHDSRRICRMLGARDRLGWFENVTRMVKNGAQLTPAEVEAVSTYLSKAVKDAPGLCK